MKFEAFGPLFEVIFQCFRHWPEDGTLNHAFCMGGGGGYWCGCPCAQNLKQAGLGEDL